MTAAEREETDPRIRLDRLQLLEHGKRLADLQMQFDEMILILRRIASKVGA